MATSPGSFGSFRVMNGDERPIAAIATPIAQSAIAVIRVTGNGSVGLLATRFSRPDALLAAAGHTLHHGVVRDREGCPLDEVLVAVYRRPRSYTGEESAEVFCHGSPAGVRLVLGALLDAGFAAAEPGEFTRRAFLNGKLDLTRAEAVNEIVCAQTSTAHALALDRLSGRVESAVRDVRERLVSVMARLAIQLDYPEEETGEIDVDPAPLQAAGARCREIAASFGRGRLFQEGARVALAGRTNAGKSSLFNELLQQDRSIVSEVHGTTRDYVEATIDVGGVPVRLFDTAGLRAAGEAIEEEGIRRSKAVIAAADLVLYVVDSREGVSADDLSRLDEVRTTTPAIVVMNKVDLAGATRRARPPAGDGPGEADEDDRPPGDGPGHAEDGVAERALPPEAPAVRVSARTGSGIGELNDAIVAHLAGEPAAARPQSGAVVIDSQRQHALLVRAADAIDLALASLAGGVPADAVAVDLQEAIDAIGEITGEVASAEILEAMFAGFCVGK